MTEIEGLKRKLTSKLGATVPALVPDWQVLFCLISSEYDERRCWKLIWALETCLLLLKVSGDKKKMVIDIGRIAISAETVMASLC